MNKFQHQNARAARHIIRRLFDATNEVLRFTRPLDDDSNAKREEVKKIGGKVAQAHSNLRGQVIPKEQQVEFLTDTSNLVEEARADITALMETVDDGSANMLLTAHTVLTQAYFHLIGITEDVKERDFVSKHPEYDEDDEIEVDFADEDDEGPTSLSL